MLRNGIETNKMPMSLPLGWGVESVVRILNLPPITLDEVLEES
jgi:hypothetical protein